MVDADDAVTDSAGPAFEHFPLLAVEFLDGAQILHHPVIEAIGGYRKKLSHGIEIPTHIVQLLADGCTDLPA